MYIDQLGAEEDQKAMQDAMASIQRQVLEQQAWAMKQASTSNRAKYGILSVVTTALVLGTLGIGGYYIGKSKYWWR